MMIQMVKDPYVMVTDFELIRELFYRHSEVTEGKYFLKISQLFSGL
jgi:hypothetical protein